jgi:hypothetical protein
MKSWLAFLDLKPSMSEGEVLKTQITAQIGALVEKSPGLGAKLFWLCRIRSFVQLSQWK